MAKSCTVQCRKTCRRIQRCNVLRVSALPNPPQPIYTGTHLYWHLFCMERLYLAHSGPLWRPIANWAGVHRTVVLLLCECLQTAQAAYMMRHMLPQDVHGNVQACTPRRMYTPANCVPCTPSAEVSVLPACRRGQVLSHPAADRINSAS
jgi:hypothetical protein